MENTIFNRCRPAALAALLVAAGPALSAQGKGPAKPGFGLAVTLLSPGDYAANIAGLGFAGGGFWQTPFAGSLHGRIGADYAIYGGQKYLDIDWEMSQVGASYDVLYYFSDKFYALAGAGYYRTEITGKLAGFESSESLSDVGFGVGVGLSLSANFALEAKYFSIEDYPRTQISVLWRF
jgi:hypothetical protein